MRVALIETMAGFAAIEAQWRGLEARTIPTSPYACFDWVAMSWPQSHRPPVVLTVWDGERLILGLPLTRKAEEADGRAHYVGLTGAMIQPVEPLIDREVDAAATLDTALAGLRSAGRGATLRLGGIPADSLLGRRLPNEPSFAGDSAVIDLPDGFAPFWAGLSQKLRAQQRRMLRQLAARVRVADSASWAADLDWFLMTKRAWTASDGEPLRPWLVSAVAREGLSWLGERWADTGRAFLTVLETGGERAAATLSFALGDQATFYATTYDPAYAAYSPGRGLMIETVRLLAERGITRIDLMQYPSAYKDRLKSATCVMRTVMVDLAAYSPDGSP
jgi:CelD/BcsL family acetyltransferase involved in cellulose biosynthesis